MPLVLIRRLDHVARRQVVAVPVAVVVRDLPRQTDGRRRREIRTVAARGEERDRVRVPGGTRILRLEAVPVDGAGGEAEHANAPAEPLGSLEHEARAEAVRDEREALRL